MSGCECTSFEEGDWVECALNPDFFGIILNESDFGRYYTVQLAVSLEIRSFHWATLRHAPEYEESGGDPPVGARKDNVIVVHFGADTETKGAA
jgi:hypothetical protein